MAEVKPKTRGNGQGYAFKRGNTWTAQITLWEQLPDGTKKRKYKSKGGFKLKRDALAYIEKLKSEPEVNKSISFNGVYNEWSASHYPRVSNDAANGYKAAYAKCSALYARPFAAIRTAELQKVVDEAKTLKDGKPCSRRAKADIKSLFSNMYKYALQNEYCNKDYAQYIVLDKKEKSKKDAFTADEIAALWKDYNAGNSFTGYVLMMIYTGMRYGELATLRCENVHIKERYMVCGIKTEAGIDRTIPIADKILPIVEKFLDGRTDGKFLTMHEKVYYNDFRRTLERCNVRALSPHCCRHTTASALGALGVPPAVIIAILGHTDYSTTLSNYTHIKLPEMLDAVNKIC